MRFLIDTNLPRALADWMSAKGHQCEHVLDLQLAQSDDKEIWRHATNNDAIVVSKDEDFADLVRQNQLGPSVLWVRTGNGTNRQLLAYLEQFWPHIEARFAMGDRLVEIR